MSFTLKQQVEIEQITDCSKTEGAAVMPRWQRKALAARTPTKAAAAPTASKTPSKTPKKCCTPKVQWPVRLLAGFVPLVRL